MGLEALSGNVAWVERCLRLAGFCGVSRMQPVAVVLTYCMIGVLSENPTCLVCIARRVPMTEKVNVMLGIDQFTTKQDLQGVILASDVR